MKFTKKHFKRHSKRLTKHAHKHVRKRWRDKKQRHKVIAGAAIILIVVITLIGYALIRITEELPAKRLVTFHDRGKDHVILTDATTVRNALEDARIVVNQTDVVEPNINSELLDSDSAVIIYRSRPVLIVDGALRQKIVTPAASPNEILTAANMNELGQDDKATIAEGNIIADGATAILTIERAKPTPVSKIVFAPTAQTLTPSRGAQIFTDSNGVAHRETYYDLPMNIVIGACGPGDYTIRYDGAKIDKDGYVLVAASYRNYPKCSVVETSMGPGKVYDTGGFALRYPHGFDLATDWTNNNGR